MSSRTYKRKKISQAVWAAIILGIASILAAIIQRSNTPAILEPTQTSIRDCSQYTELGPWDTYGNVLIDARDGWVQADFWSPKQTLYKGYDEVSVIFEPGLKVEVIGVQGNGFRYERNWTKQDVERCLEKHIVDRWNIAQRKLKYITPTELCAIIVCR